MFPHTKPPVGTQINPLHPLSQGLVGCWLFNEGAGSLANDISGNKNHGRLTNMSPNVHESGWGGSKFGSGLDYDGVDDYVDFGSKPSLAAHGARTIEVWMKTTQLIGERGLLGFIALNHYAGINFIGALPLLFLNTGNFRYWADVSSYFDGNLHHFVFTLTGTAQNDIINATLKIDNELISTGYTVSTNSPLACDRHLLGTSNKGFFNGSIRSVSIHNRVLSAEEVAWSYREPYAMFEPSFNPALLYSAAPPVGAIMNQFQKANIGADLYNGVFA